MKSKTITISDHTQLSRKNARVDIMTFAGTFSERSAVGITSSIEELRTKVDRDFFERTNNHDRGYQI